MTEIADSQTNPDPYAITTGSELRKQVEAWAKENGKKILAVSKDGDWKAFADQSERIDCVDDLGAAMATLVAAKEASVADAWIVLQSIQSGEPAEVAETLHRQLEHAVEAEIPYAEFDGPMPGVDEGVTLTLLEFQIPGIEDKSTSLDIVRVRPGGFVMRVPIEIKARALADIHFSIYDSIDKDHVAMGSTDVEREISFDAFALIDCEKAEIDEDGDKATMFEIIGAELVGAPRSIDLGYVDYSLAEDDDGFDLDDLKADQG